MATLLYCDDDLLLQHFVQLALRGTPYLVSLASDGLEALALMEQQPPDLVLTDIRMPRCGGLELLARLKAQPSLASCPVVLVTGDDIAYHECHQDVTAVLFKPFTRAELLTMIETVLSARAAV